MIISIPNTTELSQKSASLRHQLKKWEKQFATANNGRKACREDIKKDPAIGARSFMCIHCFYSYFVASKYKEYTKIREILSGKNSLPSSSHHKSRKRKATHEPALTPSKRVQEGTPAKKSLRPADFDLYDSPSTAR